MEFCFGCFLVIASFIPFQENSEMVIIILEKGFENEPFYKHYLDLADIFQFHTAQMLMCVFLTVFFFAPCGWLIPQQPSVDFCWETFVFFYI